MIYGQDKKKSPRNAALILDWIHIVIGFLVVLFAVIAFLNPEDNRILEKGWSCDSVCDRWFFADRDGNQCHQYLEVKRESRDYPIIKIL